MTPLGAAIDAGMLRFMLAYLGVGFFIAVWLAFRMLVMRDVVFELNRDVDPRLLPFALALFLAAIPLIWPVIIIQTFDKENKWKR